MGASSSRCRAGGGEASSRVDIVLLLVAGVGVKSVAAVHAGGVCLGIAAIQVRVNTWIGLVHQVRRMGASSGSGRTSSSGVGSIRVVGSVRGILVRLSASQEAIMGFVVTRSSGISRMNVVLGLGTCRVSACLVVVGAHRVLDLVHDR